MSWRAHVTAAHTISSSPAVDGSALPPHAPISSATDPLPTACTSPSTFNALLPLYRRRTAATSHQRSLVVLPLLASRVQLIAKVGYCTSSNMATTDGPWTRAGKEQTNSNRLRAHLTLVQPCPSHTRPQRPSAMVTFRCNHRPTRVYRDTTTNNLTGGHGDTCRENIYTCKLSIGVVCLVIGVH
jgi:hypothetical protein